MKWISLEDTCHMTYTYTGHVVRTASRSSSARLVASLSIVGGLFYQIISESHVVFPQIDVTKDVM